MRVKTFQIDWQIWLCLILISVATFIAYHDIVNQEFLHWDDYDYILNVPYLRAINGESLTWMFTEFYMFNWHPVTWLSLAINFEFGGENPLPFKITNIVIHLTNAFLLCLLTIQILRTSHKNYGTNSILLNTKYLYISGILTAALFALAPQHVESVIWVSDRKDLLCGMFFLLTIYFYIKLHSGYKIWKPLPLTCFTLALMSKSMALTLPLVLLLLDFYPLNRIHNQESLFRNIVRLMLEKWIFFFICLLVASITLITQNFQIQSIENFGILARVINSSDSIIHYLWTILYPMGLSAYYPRPDFSRTLGIAHLVPLALVACIFYICGYCWKKGIRFPLTAWLFTLITLLPVLDIVKVGTAGAADRYNYIPTMSIYIILGVAFTYAYVKLNKPLKPLPVAVAFTMLIISFIVSSNDSQHWRSDYTLWKSVLEKHDSVVAHNNLAVYFYKSGKNEEANSHIKKALTINPGYTQSLINISLYHERRKQIAEAESYIVKMVELNPNDFESLVLAADFYRRQGRAQKAGQLYQSALQLRPSSPDILAKSALVALSLSDFDKAQRLLEFSYTLDKDNLAAMQVLLKLFIIRQQITEAVQQAKRILESHPDNKFAQDVLNKLTPNEPESPS